MLTPKQQILLDQLKEKFPSMFSQFLLEPVESPEFKRSRDVANRVAEITDSISKMEITPRLVSRETTYHEKIIDMWTRKYICQRDPHGNIICPF